MGIDNGPSKEARLMSEFSNFTKDRFQKIWDKVIGGNQNLIREKHVKVGNELPVVYQNKMTRAKVWFENGDDDGVTMSWNNERGEFTRLRIEKDSLIGVQKADSGEEAVVVMRYKKDPVNGDKQTIRKYYPDKEAMWK